MSSEIILFGCLLGFLIAVLEGLLAQQKRQATQKLSVRRVPPVTTPRPQYSYSPWGWMTLVRPPAYHPIKRHLERAIGPRIPYRASGVGPFRMPQKRKGKARILVENWQKSIIGLVKLADKNLELARDHMKLRNHKEAVQTAATSIENIARALIHCCGGKPDPTGGQEEALRILSRRFKGNEKSELERAIDNVARIGYNKSVLRYISTQNMRTRLFNKERTEQILESASKIVGLFKHIIIEHFGEEIPELLSVKA